MAVRQVHLGDVAAPLHDGPAGTLPAATPAGEPFASGGAAATGGTEHDRGEPPGCLLTASPPLMPAVPPARSDLPVSTNIAAWATAADGAALPAKVDVKAGHRGDLVTQDRLTVGFSR